MVSPEDVTHGEELTCFALTGCPSDVQIHPGTRPIAGPRFGATFQA